MRSRLAAALSLFALVLPVLAFGQTTVYVDDDALGDPGPGDPSVSDPLEDGTPGHPYDSIQEGLDAAVADDTVEVLDGTYTGVGNRDIRFNGKAITVRSQNGPAATIVDCQGLGRGFLFADAETTTSVLQGLTITNGSKHGDSLDGRGGAILCEGSGPAITGCVIEGSSAGYGGGIGLQSSAAEVVECTISGNTATADGGGVYACGGSPTIDGCTVTGNSASINGGGVSCRDTSVCTLSTSTVLDNDAGMCGGGVYVNNSTSATVSACTISNNTSTDDGGGVYSQNSDFDLVGCTLADNTTGNRGGGATCWTNTGGSVSACTFAGNSATGNGGGLCIWQSSSVVTNCVFTGNVTEQNGGGIACRAAAPTITNCTITGNSADARGGAVYCERSSTAAVTDCILWGNLSATGGHELAVTSTAYPSTLTVRFSDVQGGAGEAYVEAGCALDLDASNIDADPLFVSAGDQGHFLSQTAAGQPTTSPCVDAGSDAAAGLGLGELTTRVDLMPDAGVVDMGYHVPYTLWITDVYWDQASASVVITFASEAGVDYQLERADAGGYADGLAWYSLPGDTLVGADGQDSFADRLTTNPLTASFRFYRVKRTDATQVTSQTAGVFELPINAAATTLYFVSTPLLPDPDHNSVAAVFGEGAGRQVPRTNFTVSDLNESSGAVSRMRNASGTYSVLAGSAFTIQPGVGYEVYLGTGLQTQFKLRLTGYVPETSLVVPLTKQSGQAIRWMGYSMPRAIKLSALGLVEAVTPSWNSANKVRLLPPGSSAWGTYTYSTTTQTWSPSDPDLVPGVGIIFIRQGFDNLTDMLEEERWYVRPPNEW